MVARKLTHWAHPGEVDCPQHRRSGAECFPKHQLPLNITSYWPTPYLSDAYNFPYHHLNPASRLWTHSLAWWHSCLSPALPGSPFPSQSLTSVPAPPHEFPPWPRVSHWQHWEWNFQELFMAVSLTCLWRLPTNVEAFISVHWFQFAVVISWAPIGPHTQTLLQGIAERSSEFLG